ncbi:hypothetical protein LCGC14_1473250 [marine sediment metagenome]|uniref:Uncharacterized protein n=1 Tax=marine sediment metagenome TaxID=412755 RepID=A0A0F9LS71_9ZZZZ
MTTPGTITAGELRDLHLEADEYLAAIGNGERLHKGSPQGTTRKTGCLCNFWAYSVIALEIRDACEIKYSRLCRHCFPELPAATKT